MKYLLFSATWCSPCKQLTPIMEKVKQQNIPVRKVDIEEEDSLASEYGIRSVPTVILLDPAGFELSRTVGVKPESFYVDLYNKHKDNLAFKM